MAIENSIDIGQAARIVEVSHDPTSVATDTEKGSLILERSTGFLYRKQDNGASTNVLFMGFELGTGLALNNGVLDVDTEDDDFAGNLVAAGLAAQVVKSDFEETTTSSTYVDKAELVTPADLFGDFWIEFTVEFRNKASGRVTRMRLYNVTDDETLNEAGISGDEWASGAGYDIVTMEGESKTFKIQYRRVGAGGGNEAEIRRARIRFFRKSAGEVIISSSSSSSSE